MTQGDNSAIRLIQFQMAEGGRRVGLIEGNVVFDLTDLNARWDRIYHIFVEANRAGKTIEGYISDSSFQSRASTLIYSDLVRRRPGEGESWILPPLDHPDPAHCVIVVTGLTHLGSASQRDEMHAEANVPQTDSQKMFEMGLKGGKPKAGVRGIQPECFQKGTGVILRGHNDFLDIPPFTDDGGEEPEIAGCYIIGEQGTPHRLGFAIGNEWSDHAMERLNYLWLGHSKQRVCSIGPELITDHPFKDIRGFCRIFLGKKGIYDSGELLTGGEHMSHSLANMEDHHFKYPQFRIPGDVHIFFFGTMKFSFGSRGPLRDGDRIEIQFSGMGNPLINYVRRIPPDPNPVIVRKG